MRPREVGPPVRGKNSPVHGGVEFAEPCDLRVVLVRIVETVVGLRQPLAIVFHEAGAERVVRLPGVLKGRIGFPAPGEREGLEAVGGGVAEVVLH